MVLKTLSDLLADLNKKPQLEEQVFLAMELGLFREKVVQAILEISLANKLKALDTLHEVESDGKILKKCTECNVFIDMVRDACTVYISQGAEAAKDRLEHSRGDHLLKHFDAPGLCPELFIDITNETMLLFELVHRVAEGTEAHAKIHQDKWKTIDPEECSETLFSLSNPHRLNLMMLLKEEEQSFSELSNQTGLRTGHLQFHLRTLMERGLVDKEERGIYRLNSRGHTALDYLADFQSFMCREDERDELLTNGTSEE